MLQGNSGNDSIGGRDGDDEISGGNGHDQLRGGYGDDFIHGGDGNDVIAGGGGSDQLWGDHGHDTFEFGNDWGHDVILDFENGLDFLDLSDVSGLNTFNQLTISEGWFGTTISFDGQDILLGGIASNTIHSDDFIL